MATPTDTTVALASATDTKRPYWASESVVPWELDHVAVQERFAADGGLPDYPSEILSKSFPVISSPELSTLNPA